MPLSGNGALNKRHTSFQAQFHRRWNVLNDPHVRALAWLIDAPDLLNPHASQWNGQIASLPINAGCDAYEWLRALDNDPNALHAYIDLQPFSRLGRYAEKLMAFYFRHQGTLVAHGVQVQAGKNDTVGEFDFLLRDGAALVHWEFATKFYLLESSGVEQQADYFVGPNLADTLGAKMRKILNRQLALSRNPAAQMHLPQPVSSAQALVKGWLFYHGDELAPNGELGVSNAHCSGFWCALPELDTIDGERFIILPRLRWLAPAKSDFSEALNKQSLQAILVAHFDEDPMPVLVAIVERQGDYAIETGRGFIVPHDWRSRAGARIRRAVF